MILLNNNRLRNVVCHCLVASSFNKIRRFGKLPVGLGLFSYTVKGFGLDFNKHFKYMIMPVMYS